MSAAAALLAGRRAVLFDAGFTLLAPRRAVLVVYLSEAAALGIALEPRAFGAALKAAWPRAIADYRSKHPDLESSEEAERAAWRDFTADLARGFPALAGRHGEWHARLVAWFDGPAAWEVAPGARELLAELRGAGVRLGVVSNWHGALPGLLAALGLAAAFEVVVTSAGAGRKKPHPAIFRTALAALGVAAAETAHVGDSLAEDVRGAAAAGIAPVWLAPADDDEAAGVLRVASLDELRLNGMPPGGSAGPSGRTAGTPPG